MLTKKYQIILGIFGNFLGMYRELVIMKIWGEIKQEIVGYGCLGV